MIKLQTYRVANITVVIMIRMKNIPIKITTITTITSNNREKECPICRTGSSIY